MSENIYELLLNRFPEDRSLCAIESPTRCNYSYGRVEEETNRLAGTLLKLGVSPGDRVAVQTGKSPEAILLYLACLQTGAVYLPLNTAYQPAEIQYFLEDASPNILVCTHEKQEALNPITKIRGIRVYTLDVLGGGSLMDETASVEPFLDTIPRGSDDIAAILYTSGTTGRSKGAMITHRNLSSNALTLHRCWGWVPGDVLLHALPIYHVHGLFVALHCALLNASKIIFLQKFDAPEIIHQLPRASVFMGVPTYYARLCANEEFDRECCRNMRLFISGSAPLLPETFHAFHERSGHTILERYGMTEAGMITSNPLNGERIAETVGAPLPGVEARVCTNAGEQLESGEVGILEIKGPNVFKGYWNMPEKTREDFREDGFFITGDMAKMNKNGVISIVGRVKDLIISGGLNVYPKEIESALDQQDGVEESAVFGIHHPDLGEAVTAVAVLKNGGIYDEAGWQSSLRKSFAGFKVPKRILCVEKLPRNSMGKVQKSILRKKYRNLFRDEVPC